MRKIWEQLLAYIRLTANISEQVDTDAAEESIRKNIYFKGPNVWILAFSIVIASVGLNVNSPAVIIGAMLISPLMGGLTAIAYGIATNNMNLAKWSAFRLTIQVIISVFTSYVYFLISPISTASSELLARTSPTVWDVLIATAGGFAGIIGQTRKEKSNVIPGVAIATALMPPLCTAGYGLANGNLSYFGGAMYLFFINGFFITLTAIIVLKYLRVPQFKDLEKKQIRKIHRNIAVLATITVIPSVMLAYNTVKDTIESSNIDSYIKNEFVFQGTQVVQKSVDTQEKVIEVSLIGLEITPDQKAELEEKLGDYNLGDYDLLLTQTTVKSGMTAEEVKAMLEEYESTDEEPDVEEILAAKRAEELEEENQELSSENEQLKNDNSALQAAVEEAQSQRIDVAQLSKELTALNDKIRGATAGDSLVYVEGDQEASQVTVVTLLIDGKLSEKELSSIEGWLTQRLERENIVVLTEDLNTVHPQDSQSDESSKAEKTEKEDKSIRSQGKGT